MGDYQPAVRDVWRCTAPCHSQEDGLGILNDSANKSLLMLELAATVDAGLPLVQTTYTLEGDGPLAFSCYERLDKLMQAIRISHFLNVSRIAQLLSNGQPNGAILSQQFTQYAKSCVEPGYEYFQGKFHGAVRIAVAAFRAACLFAPHKVRDQPDASAVDEISAFPFLNDTG